MTSIPRFAAYAAAFEKAYESNDWSIVEPFFTEDAVYEIKGSGPPLGAISRGRAAILAYFDRILNGFDRRFATRELILREGPRERDGAVWIKGGVRYTAPGVPDLEFDLEESVWFEGDRIRRLEDSYDAANAAALLRWVEAHGAKVGLAIE